MIESNVICGIPYFLHVIYLKIYVQSRLNTCFHGFLAKNVDYIGEIFTISNISPSFPLSNV